MPRYDAVIITGWGTYVPIRFVSGVRNEKPRRHQVDRHEQPIQNTTGVHKRGA